MEYSNQTEQYWQQEQQKNQTQVQKLSDLLAQGQKLGIDFEPSLLEKIKHLEKEVKEAKRKLRVVFTGGFSEGKSTLIAAWLGKINAQAEKEFKIAMEESSNKVNIYNTEYCELVDTPGLFGYKQEDDGTYYKQKTHDYLSKSDLIIYVMNSKNPIKKSHKSLLLWLFETLDLLDRTVFVLAKFDEVADMKDEEEYIESFRVAQEKVRAELGSLLNFPSEKCASINIVAISANPKNKGLDYWEQNRATYDSLSHVKDLQNMTSAKIEQQGGDRAIILRTQESILRDVLDEVVPRAEIKFKESDEQADKVKAMCKSMWEEIQLTEANIKRDMASLKEDVKNYFVDLILQTQKLSLETANDFFEREVGDEGINIKINVENLFARHTAAANLQWVRLESRFENERNAVNDFLNTYGKVGLDHARNFMSGLDAGKIKVARDMIAPNFKFAPWGAIKMADNLAKAGGIILVIADVGLEIWNRYKLSQKEKALEETKAIMIKNFEDNRKEVINFIDSSKFIETCYGYLVDAKTNLEKVKTACQQLENSRQEFEQWKNNCKQLHNEIFVQLPMEQRTIEG